MLGNNNYVIERDTHNRYWAPIYLPRYMELGKMKCRVVLYKFPKIRKLNKILKSVCKLK